VAAWQGAAAEERAMTGETTTMHAEVRLGDVRGDRLCVRCGFNLHGQTILREPHYGLFIVRCPECSGVTSLQEYPVLGRWAKRWGFMLAAAYLLITVALLVGAGLAAGGFSVAIDYDQRIATCNTIASVHGRWFNATGQLQSMTSMSPAQAALAAATKNSVQNWGEYAAVNQYWWRTLGRESVLAAYDMRSNRFRVEIVASVMFASVASVAAGCIFAVIMPGLRGVRLLIVPAAILTLGALLNLGMPERANFIPAGWLPEYVPAGMLASEIMPAFLPYLLLAGVGVFVTLGVFIGRPLCRGLLMLFLPPRYAGAFSFLWECDGKRFRPSSGTTG
jgi:hypothetical protein